VERLALTIPLEVKHFIHYLYYLTLADMEPGWSWWPTGTKGYSAKEGYHWLLKNKLNWNENSN